MPVKRSPRSALPSGERGRRRSSQRFLRAGSPSRAGRSDVGRRIGAVGRPHRSSAGHAGRTASSRRRRRRRRAYRTRSGNSEHLAASGTGRRRPAQQPHPGNNWQPPRPPASLAPRPDNQSPLTPQPAWLSTSASRRRLLPRALLERNQVLTVRRPRPGRQRRKWPGPVVRRPVRRRSKSR